MEKAIHEMGLRSEEAVRAAVNTERVKKYLRVVAADYIDDDERDYSGERDDIWDTMTTAERDTANDLVIGVFGDWVGVS